MAIADRLNKLTTDITNAYTSIENKGGTIPANKNTNNLSTAINSIEVIESATTEGESLSLTNTKAMPYKDYVVKGKSEQATRSGKNLFKNIPFTSTQRGLTITNDGNSIKVTGTAVSEYYSSIIFYADGSYENYEWWATDGKINPTKGYFNSNQVKNVLSVISNNATTEPWFRLLIGRETQVEGTNVNFGETSTTIFNENTEKINFIALGFLPDKTYNTEFKIQIEQGSTATSYEPYGASPSPDYPSEIHSVADDVNLFDESIVTQSGFYGLQWKYDTDNRKIKITGTASGTYSQTSQYNFNIPAGTYKFTKYTNSSLTYNMWIYNSSGTLIGNTKLNNPITLNEDASKIVLFCEGTTSGTTYNEEINIKLQKGTTATPYSPYNQGTVKIKQRGKNLFDYNSYTYDKTILNAYRFIEIKNTKPSTNYVISNYDSLVNSEFTNVYLAFGTSMSEINFANLVGADYVRFYTKTNSKMYLCTYASNWTEELWNTFISYFENAQLEERNNTNFLRTISS